MSTTDRREGTGLNPWWPWAPAPLVFEQPILPQWSFGSVTINQRNSSSPSTELEIVAENSYGRQLGKVMDAVVALASAQPTAAKSPAVAELMKLHARNEEIKTAAAKRRLSQLREDLARLKRKDRGAYDAEVAELRKLIAP